MQEGDKQEQGDKQERPWYKRKRFWFCSVLVMEIIYFAVHTGLLVLSQYTGFQSKWGFNRTMEWDNYLCQNGRLTQLLVDQGFIAQGLNTNVELPFRRAMNAVNLKQCKVGMLVDFLLVKLYNCLMWAIDSTVGPYLKWFPTLSNFCRLMGVLQVLLELDASMRKLLLQMLLIVPFYIMWRHRCGLVQGVKVMLLAVLGTIKATLLSVLKKITAKLVAICAKLQDVSGVSLWLAVTKACNVPWYICFVMLIAAYYGWHEGGLLGSLKNAGTIFVVGVIGFNIGSGF